MQQREGGGVHGRNAGVYMDPPCYLLVHLHLFNRHRSHNRDTVHGYQGIALPGTLTSANPPPQAHGALSHQCTGPGKGVTGPVRQNSPSSAMQCLLCCMMGSSVHTAQPFHESLHGGASAFHLVQPSDRGALHWLLLPLHPWKICKPKLGEGKDTCSRGWRSARVL